MGIAISADTDELEPVVENQKTAVSIQVGFQFRDDIYRRINDFIASNTPDMIMICRIGIKAFYSPAEFELLNLSDFRQDFQIAVYRTQTDAGNFLPDDFIYLVRTRVRFQFLQFLQNDGPLPGKSQGMRSGQISSPWASG